MTEITISANRFQALQEYSALSGIPVEELVDQALTEFIEDEAAKKV